MNKTDERANAACRLYLTKITEHFDRLDELAHESASGSPLPQTILGIRVPDFIVDHAKTCGGCRSLLARRLDAMIETLVRSGEARRARQRS